MNDSFPHQSLAANLTTWHITFGTYGTRLHGSKVPTVDKQHNEVGESFVSVSPVARSSRAHSHAISPNSID